MRDTLSDLIEEQAARRPDAPAVIYGDERVGYAALLERSRRVAGGFAALGIAEGDRVALWLPNTVAYIVAALALARLGAITTAVNTRFRAGEVADIVARSGARAMVLWPGFRGIDFLGILDDVPPAALAGLESLVLYDEGDAGNVVPAGVAHCRRIRWAELEAATPFDGDRADPASGCNTFTTSGTTSRPKFVLHTQFSIARHARVVAERFGLSEADGGLLQALPFCGVFGFCQLTAGLAAGRPLIVMNAFDPAEAAALIDRHGVEVLFVTDGMVASWLACRADTPVFPTVKRCYYGLFDPALADIAERAADRGLTLIGLYGMSEVQALFSMQRPDAPFAQRIAGGGRPVSPDYDVRVRDPETGALLPAGEQGEIELRGPSLMKEYFANPEATADAFTDDGYLRSGDLGYLAEDGAFVFVSRMGDVLRLGGFLVAPAEIESHLGAHPAVDGCQVVGATTAEGLRAIAFVTLNPGQPFDEAALRAHCLDGLARFKAPARIVAIDTFPTTKSANGTKIQRARLREMAENLLCEETASRP